MNARNSGLLKSTRSNIIFASPDTEINRLGMLAISKNFPEYGDAENSINLDQFIKAQKSMVALAGSKENLIYTEFPMLFLANGAQFNTLLSHSVLVMTTNDLNKIQKSIDCYLWESDQSKEKSNKAFKNYWDSFQGSVVLLDDLNGDRRYYRFIQSVCEKTGLTMPAKLKPLKSTPEKIKNGIKKISNRISNRDSPAYN